LKGRLLIDTLPVLANADAWLAVGPDELAFDAVPLPIVHTGELSSDGWQQSRQWAEAT
jgi:hypothetical protein